MILLGPQPKVYRVTEQLVQNLLLTSKQKFHYGLARLGQNGTFVLKSTGGFAQAARSPCKFKVVSNSGSRKKNMYPFFGCCTADSKHNLGRHQLYLLKQKATIHKQHSCLLDRPGAGSIRRQRPRDWLGHPGPRGDLQLRPHTQLQRRLPL